MKCDDVMTSLTHPDNHPGVVINCAKFGVGLPSSFHTVNKNNPNNPRYVQ